MASDSGGSAEEEVREKEIFAPRKPFSRSPPKEVSAAVPIYNTEEGNLSSMEPVVLPAPTMRNDESNLIDDKSSQANERELNGKKEEKFKEVVITCGRSDVDEALSETNILVRMMEKAGEGRKRTFSASADAEEERSGKRRMEMSPPRNTGKKMKDSPSFTQMAALLAKLEKQVMEQTTVKKETKQQMLSVCAYFNKLRREQEDYVRGLVVYREDAAARRRCEFLSRMRNAQSIDDIANVVAEEWPAGVFDRTSVVKNISPYENGATYSVLINPNKMGEDQTFAALCTMVPAVKSVTAERLRELVSIPITQEESISMPGVDDTKCTKRTIVYASVLGEGAPAVADLVKWADHLRKFSVENRSADIVIDVPEGITVELLRRVFECRFIDTSTKIALRSGESQKRPVKNNLIVTGGGSYAEMVKQLTRDITPEQLGVRAKTRKQRREARSGSRRR